MNEMTGNVTTLQSRVIDWLRFPLAAAVVLLHASESTTGNYGTDFYGILSLILSQGICRIAVPCFFFFSGFLFFSNLDSWNIQVWVDKIKKRFFSLFVPYIIWNVIALLAVFGYGWLRARFNPDVATSSFIGTLNANGWLDMFWSSNFGCPIDYPLWFIRDLIVFVLLTPLIHFIVKRTGLWGVVVSFVLCALTESRDFEGLFFFMFGAYFRLYGIDFIEVFRKSRFPSYICCLVGIIIIACSYGRYPQLYWYTKYLFVFFGTVSIISLVSASLKGNDKMPNRFLASSAFFIYASHAILILHDISHYVVLHLMPFTNQTGMVLALFMKSILALSICLGLYATLKRFTPELLSVLTGGRG